MKINRKTKNFGAEQGFTLAELAIVMIIIGLLTAGLIKGYAMVAVAKEKKFIRTIDDIKASVLLFKDQYGYLPGDLPDAMVKLPDCTVANFCVNGDGNGYVGSDGTEQYDWLSSTVGNGIERETIQFWKHLRLTGLTEGVDVAGDPDNPAWERTHPRSPYGGGFEFYYDKDTGLGSKGGHILRLTENAVSPGGGLIEGAINPHQAAHIDLIIDDYNPATGFIFADYGEDTNDCKTTLDGNPAYNESASLTNKCILYIYITR